MQETLTFGDTVLRLTAAMLFGGIIGLERARKRRPAGFRTYMVVCIGAALAMLLNQYDFFMLHTRWESSIQALGVNTDVSRFGAQVINGIGFLGAGTIIVTGKQEVKGLTTAAGLWAAACMGLAIGAGFIAGAVIGGLLILICMRVLPKLEKKMLASSRRMNLAVELPAVSELPGVVERIKELGAQIIETEINRDGDTSSAYPCAIFYLRFEDHFSHTSFLAELAMLDCILSAEEI